MAARSGPQPNAAAHACYPYLLAIVRRGEQAWAASPRVLGLDPFNSLLHGLAAVVLYFERKFDEVV